MPSQISILFGNIDENYPVAGVDNDTQGFRDNFDVIKSSLAIAASEVTILQDTTAKINTANNFGGNDLSNLNIASATEKTNNLQLIPASDDFFLIQYRNGPYQYATLASNRTLQIAWGIESDSILAPGRLAKLTLQFVSDSITPRTVSFAPSSAYIYDETFPVTLEVGADPVIIELWTFDGGARIYAKYIGTFSTRA
jgi:hypothetical protein